MIPVITIDSLYLIGEKYKFFSDSKVEEMSEYERDEWATQLLYDNDMHVRENVYCTISEGEIIIQNTDYKVRP